MIREIVELGNPLLRTRSEPVPDPRAAGVESLVVDLLDTLHDFQRRTGYGRGIAAPQVGALKRVVVIDPLPEDQSGLAVATSFPLILVNPTIVDLGPDTDLVWDACFSYWGFFFQVRRHRRVSVDYTAPDGRPCRLEATGDLSELLQHEIDHLAGILALDLIADPLSLRTLKEHERLGKGN